MELEVTGPSDFPLDAVFAQPEIDMLHVVALLDFVSRGAFMGLMCPGKVVEFTSVKLSDGLVDFAGHTWKMSHRAEVEQSGSRLNRSRC